MCTRKPYSPAPDEEWEILSRGGDALKVRRRKWASCVRMLSEPSRELQFDNSNPASNKKYVLHNQRNTCYKSEKYFYHNQRNTHGNIWKIQNVRDRRAAWECYQSPVVINNLIIPTHPPSSFSHSAILFSGYLFSCIVSLQSECAIGFTEEQQLFCISLSELNVHVKASYSGFIGNATTITSEGFPCCDQIGLLWFWSFHPNNFMKT